MDPWTGARIGPLWTAYEQRLQASLQRSRRLSHRPSAATCPGIGYVELSRFNGKIPTMLVTRAPSRLHHRTQSHPSTITRPPVPISSSTSISLHRHVLPRPPLDIDALPASTAPTTLAHTCFDHDWHNPASVSPAPTHHARDRRGQYASSSPTIARGARAATTRGTCPRPSQHLHSLVASA